ncbi:MAG TPA: pyridoxal-phosphate dependent enzyme [Gemmatimonadaceae bacterium]|nr:pyridoxal-phosphate dependent enzyme [Gemmatimonadaceae bacterium]
MQAPADFLRQHLELPTRLIRAESLSRDGHAVWLKLESELPTGSFKVRGASYALAIRMEQGPVREVVAASTGNHGAAVAWAAKTLGTGARIFVPHGANPAKTGKIQALGAALTEAGTTLTHAIRAAEEYASKSDAFLLADAGDGDVPVGAGTLGTEIVRQLPDVDVIYTGVGDTALIRGVARAAKTIKPAVRFVGVQAEEAPAYFRSWKSGRVERTETADTIADGLATTDPLQLNVDAIRELVDDMQLVSEQELLDAIALVLKEERLVIEPAAASTVAAIRSVPPVGANVVLVISGGNIAPDVLDRARRLIPRQPTAPSSQSAQPDQDL